MPKNSDNPVLSVIHGIEVRRYNYVSMMFTAQRYEELIDEADKTGLSIAKLIAIKSQPCKVCHCDNVTLVIKKDGKSNIQNTSENIISKNAKRHQNTSGDN